MAIWLIFLLLFPKRGLGTIAQRLRQTEAGDRAFVFWPPARIGGSVPALVAGELAMLVELGLPIYMWAWRAENVGRRRPNLGKASQLPASLKASPAKSRQYTMPPMAWRREWEAVLSERVGHAQAARAAVAPAAAVLTQRSLR